MKILLVTDYATPTGGMEMLLLRLRDALRKHGHDARLFASSAKPLDVANQADYECLGTTSRWRTLLQTANPWAWMKLHRVLDDFKPDLVHLGVFLTQLSPLILTPLRKIPTLHHVGWYRAVCPVGTKTLPDGTECRSPAGVVCYRNRCLPLRDWVPLMIQTYLWRRWRSTCDVHVAVSNATRHRLLGEGFAPVELIPNGVSVTPCPLPLHPSPTVTFAGRLVEQKGADILLRAFATVVAQIPEARLIIAGTGPEETRLSRMVSALGLSSSVTLLGHLSAPEMEKHLAGAWVHVVPSRWAEAFGLTAVEAMMRGTAVVASRCDGLAEIVRDGVTGYLVPPGNPEALAGALCRLLGDRTLAETMGTAARGIAIERYSEEHWVTRLLGLYRTLLHA